MKINVTKSRSKDQLSYKVEFTESELTSFSNYGHELKCFIIFDDDDNKNIDDFEFNHFTNDEDRDNNYTKIKFSYYDKRNIDLIYNFQITFPGEKELVINNITLKNIRDNTFIRNSTDQFRIESADAVKKILEHLLNRPNQGCHCNKCDHLFFRNLEKKCPLVFIKRKAKKQ